MPDKWDTTLLCQRSMINIVGNNSKSELFIFFLTCMFWCRTDLALKKHNKNAYLGELGPSLASASDTWLLGSMPSQRKTKQP